VIRRLTAAGGVLIGKTSVEALAFGAIWYGGQTRNPWNTEEGSRGSSAGSVAATAAGLAGFALGTETLGSIVAPCARCGTVGLRPTFGRVSRAGAMSLCWSLDKIGPICRSVDDAALVLAAVNGFDAADLSSIEAPFGWDATRAPAGMRVGYIESDFTDIPGASAYHRCSRESVPRIRTGTRSNACRLRSSADACVRRQARSRVSCASNDTATAISTFDGQAGVPVTRADRRELSTFANWTCDSLARPSLGWQSLK
jgi:Asp-tRNA(Asn)/Glu-tRNA(Gln) amidotransferase A subunit family amidase